MDDEDYRTDFLASRTREQRIDVWYARNAEIYVLHRQIAPLVSHSTREAQVNNEKIEQAMRRLEALLAARLEELESSVAFQAHLAIEAGEPEVDRYQLDSGMVNLIADLNLIPGVKTVFSCQGLRRWTDVPGWKPGPIFFPGHHMPLAHVAFTTIPESMFQTWARTLQAVGVGRARPWRNASALESMDPTLNASFCDALVNLAASAIARAVDDGAPPPAPSSGLSVWHDGRLQSPRGLPN